MKRFRWFLLACAFATGAANAGSSVCYGTVARGSLEGGVQLPKQGPNFGPYTLLGVLAGRTYVHSSVAEIVIDSYANLAKSSPSKHYVYGESGWAVGGRIRPHRTHQNGTSVDFMVPVLDKENRSVELPISPLNKYGYSLEFDSTGRYEDLKIDFEAIGDHLFQLSTAARTQGIGLARVIFDEQYLPQLFATRRGPYLRKLPFMKGKPWIRHDEHYHVDFGVECKPLSG